MSIKDVYTKRSKRAASILLERMGLNKEQYEESFLDDEEDYDHESKMVSVPSYLAADLHQWHWGQSDPVYAVGSSAYAGQPVPKSVVEDAIDGLESLEDDEGLSEQDREALGELIAELQEIVVGDDVSDPRWFKENKGE